MRKFIVTSDGRLRFGDVNMHRDLLRPGEECIGGGVYEFDYASGRMLLSGKSYDFGRVKWSWIDTLLLPDTIAGVDIFYEDIPLADFCKLKYQRIP